MALVYISWVAIIGYLLGSWQQRQTLYKQTDKQQPKPSWLSLAAWCVHGVSLFGILSVMSSPILSIGVSASLAAWLITGIVIYSSFRKPTSSLLIVIMPLSSLCVALTMYTPLAASSQDTSLGSSILFAHILLSFAAYALLAIAALLALILAYQNSVLKAHHPSTLSRALPPLQAMEGILFETLAIGVALLTLGLGSGFLFLEDMLAQKVAHKTVLSICAWFIFSGLLVGHYCLGWRGRIAIRWTLIGFGFLVVAYFGSKFVIEYIL